MTLPALINPLLRLDLPRLRQKNWSWAASDGKFGSFILYILYIHIYISKHSSWLEHGPFQDEFPIENADIPLLC